MQFVHYIREKNESGSHPTGTITVLVDEEGAVAEVGFSLLHPNDQFVKKVGRNKAFGRGKGWFNMGIKSLPIGKIPTDREFDLITEMNKFVGKILVKHPDAQTPKWYQQMFDNTEEDVEEEVVVQLT